MLQARVPADLSANVAMITTMRQFRERPIAAVPRETGQRASTLRHDPIAVAPDYSRPVPVDANGTRILIVEDVAAEAELAALHVQTSGITAVWLRVDTAAALRSALLEFRPHIVLSDFTLPGFDGTSALEVVRANAPELPFIFVSGTIGEERAIEALRQGAVDYVFKTNLSRLAPAVTRALQDAAARAERMRQDAQIARLTRVLRMLSGINAMALRMRDQHALFDEACRLAVTQGGYSAATVVLTQPDSTALVTAACFEADDQGDDGSRVHGVDRVRDDGIIEQVLSLGVPFVCNDVPQSPAIPAVAGARSRSEVALPLWLETNVVGVLMLTALETGVFSDEEMEMLHEVSATLSFALQYVYKDKTVEFLSHFDPHTGLAKRALFCERLAQALNGAAGGKGRCGVVVLDIEQLSVINDSFGRAIGDALLKQVSDRLRGQCSSTNLLAHFGGGTFAIALDIAGDGADPMMRLDQTVNAVFGNPIALDGRGSELPVTVKCGLAVYPEDGYRTDELVQKAEAALRSARVGHQRHLHYNADQRSKAVARLTLEHRLRTAIRLRQFELHYQPIVNASSGQITSIEGLIRWRDPSNGLVGPGTFLSLLESTGLITQVGRLVAEQAANDWTEWQRLGLPPVRLAINVSALELRQPQFAQHLLELIRPASGSIGLDVEITESTLLENRAAEIAILKSLRSAGVRVAIDDFGTGYSSLSRLADLPVDTLKVDRSFVRRLPADRIGTTIVSTIVTLAHAFGMTVVAEGVETRAQVDVLRALQCDCLQGFLFARPMDRVALIELLRGTAGQLIVAPDPADAAALA